MSNIYIASDCNMTVNSKRTKWVRLVTQYFQDTFKNQVYTPQPKLRAKRIPEELT